MFTALDFDFKTVLVRLRQQAYLTKGIQMTLTDERS
jgi:DNA gyrase/topoisomerase IV subunit B